MFSSFVTYIFGIHLINAMNDFDTFFKRFSPTNFIFFALIKISILLKNTPTPKQCQTLENEETGQRKHDKYSS